MNGRTRNPGSKSPAQRKVEHLTRIRDSGGAVINVSLGPEAAAALVLIANRLDVTKRRAHELALIHFAESLPPQRASLLTKKGPT